MTMTITEQINASLGIEDIYISIRINDSKTSDIISNMPDKYKEIYYSKEYQHIDDTFDYAEVEQTKVRFPNFLGDYYSKYIAKMESHGFYNLFCFSFVSDSKLISCIVTVPWKPVDNQKHFEQFREVTLNGIQSILEDFKKIKVVKKIDLDRH